MKLSAISLLLLAAGCSASGQPSDLGGNGNISSGGSNSPTAGSGGSSGAVAVPAGGSSSGGPSSAGTSALGGAPSGGGGSAGTPSGGGAGASSGGTAGSSSAGTGGTTSGGAASGGSGGAIFQTGIKPRFATGDTNTDTPIPAILGELSVINTDGGNAALNLLKVRYYFSNEAPALTFVENFGHVSSPGSQVDVPFTGTVVKMVSPKPMADSYLEFQFNSTIILDAGKTAVLNFRLYNSPSQQPILIQSNDYSFNLTPLVDTDKIVLLYRDVVIWGVEP